ncbi:unnamed protein product, partial [Lampetra planeri]
AWVPSLPPPVPSDVDPSQGLYGYTATVSLHSHSRCCFYSGYSGLHCRNGDVWDGMMTLALFDEEQRGRHSTLPAPLAIPAGCLLDLCLRESGVTLWCFSELGLPLLHHHLPPPPPPTSTPLSTTSACPPGSLLLAYADGVGSVEATLGPDHEDDYEDDYEVDEEGRRRRGGGGAAVRDDGAGGASLRLTEVDPLIGAITVPG